MDVDAVIVGAGFAGMYMLVKLRELGFTARAFEVAADVGGTWYWNRYPGARCDIESMQYSYGFSEELQQDWDWSERYATQPEILRYAQHVADRFDLRRDIQFETRVTSAIFDDATNAWTVETNRGNRVVARFVIMATGNLSTANMPKIEGQESFDGAVYHTGRWPHEPVDFTGQRVAVIGTGSSGVQAVPLIAKQADHVTVFQRTPNFIVPAHNRPLTPDERAAIKADYRGLRERMRKMPSGFWVQPAEKPATAATPEERQAAYEARWAIGGFSYLYAFNDTLLSPESNDAASEFIRARIRETVKDPAVAKHLTPDFVLGCKRVCIDSGYWDTFNRDNVTLVALAETPIERITPAGVVAGGVEHPADALIYATGFDAMTGSLKKIDIRGADGVKLIDKWAEGPKTYLGLTVAGMPNLFLITGPGSPSVLTNVITSIEHHVEWIGDVLVAMREQGNVRLEPTVGAEEAWVERVRQVAGASLRAGCGSWYSGANIKGKKQVFMPYAARFPVYVEECAAIVANGYEGFTFK